MVLATAWPQGADCSRDTGCQVPNLRLGTPAGSLGAHGLADVLPGRCQPVAGARDSRCLSYLVGLRHAPTLQRTSPGRRLVLAVHHLDCLTSGSLVHVPLACVHGSATKPAERRQSKLPGELAANSPDRARPEQEKSA
jgi:hypothetical protein